MDEWVETEDRYNVLERHVAMGSTGKMTSGVQMEEATRAVPSSCSLPGMQTYPGIQRFVTSAVRGQRVGVERRPMGLRGHRGTKRRNSRGAPVVWCTIDGTERSFSV